MGRLLRVRTGRQPHEILVLVGTLLIGIVGSAAPERISSAIALTFPWPWASAFWLGCVIFSAVTLWGIFVPKIEGLLVERLGLVVLGIFYAAYAVTVIADSGLSGLVPTVLPIAFALGNVWRVKQIGVDLALLAAYLKDHPGEEVR